MTNLEPHESMIALSTAKARLYVQATIAVVGLAVGSMLTLALAKPENTSTGTVILGILLPVITAFLAAAVGKLGDAVNGRTSQLIAQSQEAGKLEGKLEVMDKVIVVPTTQRRREGDPLPPGRAAP